jgi:BMFP domain-containing protein YqiC
MLSALEHIETRYNEKVSALEQRIVQLENAIGKNSSEKKSASS